jgi:drug/metabolite transporter (DMT)-like permease
MIYLALRIVFASGFTLLIKWIGNRKQEDIVTVGAINYVVAALSILPEFVSTNVESSSLNAVATGGVMRTCYFIIYFLVVHTVGTSGASVATVVGGLSILLPIICGALIWNDTPNVYQIVGIAFAIGAISLIGRHGDAKGADWTWGTPAVVAAFFLFAGLARLAQEAFKHGSDADQRPTFLITAFVLAAIPSSVILASRKFRVSLMELAFGCAMGFVNILQLHFTIKALQNLPGFIVFPIASAGCLVLTSLVATQLLEERLNRKTQFGILIASIALALLNWVPSS